MRGNVGKREAEKRIKIFVLGGGEMGKDERNVFKRFKKNMSQV